MSGRPRHDLRRGGRPADGELQAAHLSVEGLGCLESPGLMGASIMVFQKGFMVHIPSRESYIESKYMVYGYRIIASKYGPQSWTFIWFFLVWVGFEAWTVILIWVA